MHDLRAERSGTDLTTDAYAAQDRIRWIARERGDGFGG